MKTPLLSLERVSFRYGDHVALDAVDLALAPGARLGLLGPNGSGKSTLLKLVVGLARPKVGVVRLRTEKPLAVAFQKPSLDVRLTVRENLRTFAAVLGIPRGERDGRIDRQLAAFELSDRADSRAGALSGGLLRRADLARAFLGDAELLVLDEPTTGLDPIARKEFWTLLDRRLSASGCALLVATHLFDEAERLDEVVCLRKGKIVAAGAPGTLVAALPENVLRLRATDGAAVAARLRKDFGVEALAVGDEVLCLTPNAVQLVPQFLERFHGEVGAVTVRRPSLEDAFFSKLGGPT